MSLSFFFIALFGILIIIFSMLSIFSKNTVHSILYLILVFISASSLFFTIKADYIAIIYLVVYIGAIAVLFLFVVMMLNIKNLEIDSFYNNSIFLFSKEKADSLVFSFCYFWFIILLFKVSIVFCEAFCLYFKFWEVILFYYNVINNQNNFLISTEFPLIFLKSEQNVIQKSSLYFINTEWISQLLDLENIHIIGFMMYSIYFLSFILSSLILLIAMVGAILLTFKALYNTKQQYYFEQVARDFTKTIRLRK